MKDLAATYKGWPKWARVGAPVAAGLLVIGALGSSGDDTAAKDSSSTTVQVEFATIADATELAMDAADDAGVTNAQASSLIQAICKAADGDHSADALADRLVRLDIEEADLRPLIEGLGDGAEAFCPDVVADAPDLLNDTYAAGVKLLRAEATTTTTTEAPTTTLAPTTTAAPAAPTTTAAPRTTTTAPPPPPPAPITTAAPPPPASYVTPGAYCSPAGATGVSSTGVPMTCSTQKCDGTPYDQPRWRKTTC